MADPLVLSERVINRLWLLTLAAAWYLGAFQANPSAGVVFPLILIGIALSVWNLCIMWKRNGWPIR